MGDNFENSTCSNRNFDFLVYGGREIVIQWNG